MTNDRLGLGNGGGMSAFVLIALGVAHLVLWAEGLPLLVRALAALTIACWLPGLLLANLLLGPVRSGRQRLLLVLAGLGVGYGLEMTVFLLLSYLPGGVSRLQALVAFDGLLVVLVAVKWLTGLRTVVRSKREDGVAYTWLWRSVLMVLIISGLLRLRHLGYSEFQGDEARVLLRASEVLTGFENALMVHQKGPGEILVTAASYALVGQVNELTARLPFALANLAGLVGALLLGWRLFGRTAGLSAALLLALNGYFIAFGRIVQYQSLVYLFTVLALLILYEFIDDQTHLSRRLTLVALLIAAGLLAHYEMAGIFVPGLLLVWLLWRQGLPLRRLAPALIAPLLVGLGVVSLFYLPYLNDPNFVAAYRYVFGYRVGGGSFPHNNLVDFFQRSSLYSSSTHLLLLIAITVLFLAALYRRQWGLLVATVLASLIVVAIGCTFWLPTWFTLGGDQIWLVFLTPVAVTWLLPRVTFEERLVLIWFGMLMVVGLFMVAKPDSHVYTMFVPWVFVVGAAVQAAQAHLTVLLSPRRTAALAAIAAAVIVLLLGNYVYRMFVETQVEVLRTWHENRPVGYWYPFTEPPQWAIFGFPLRNGWKVVGALYAQGELKGMVETNAKPEVVDWYTRGAGVCPRDDRYYILADTVETGDDERLAEMERAVASEYHLTGQAMVNGQPRLRLYDRLADDAPRQYLVEEFEQTFDRTLSVPQFVARRGKVASPEMQIRLDMRLGDAIQLLGYSVDRPSVAPGGEVGVRLVWHSLATIEKSYTVFVQLIDLSTTAKAGQVDGLPVCGRNPTTHWNPGDVVEDPYQLAIAPDAALGQYRLIAGMYDAATGQRLSVSAADGHGIGDYVDLGELLVKGARQ